MTDVTTLGKRWWEADDGEELHQLVDATVNRLGSEAVGQGAVFDAMSALYVGVPSQPGSAHGGLAYDFLVDMGIRPFYTYNVVKSCVDTVVNRICKNKPDPRVLTTGADWELQQRAKKLDKFLSGELRRSGAYDQATTAFRDACIFGTGILKTFLGDDGKVRIERVLPTELWVDPAETLLGEPRQAHQRKIVQRDVLKAMFPKKRDAIDQASGDLGRVDGSTMTVLTRLGMELGSDVVRVCESWHLASGPDAKDGRHCITVRGATLLDEPWERRDLPFTILRWSKAITGFWGLGLGHELRGIQEELNGLCATIQQSMHLVSVPKVYVHKGSRLVDSHLNNEIGTVIEYEGEPPIPGQLAQVPVELFQQVDRLHQKAYELTGISQMSATSAKPKGVYSGEALRTYSDIESERVVTVAQAWESAFMDLSEKVIGCVREAVEAGERYNVRLKGREFIDTIDWNEVDMDDAMFQLSVWPASMLPQTPSGRLERVQEWYRAGWLTQEEAIKLSGLPDTDAVGDDKTAALDDIMATISGIVQDGDFRAPEPLQDLNLGIQKFTRAYLRQRHAGLPEERLDMLRQWIELAATLLAQMAPPAPMGDPGMTQESSNPQAMGQPLPGPPMGPG